MVHIHMVLGFLEDLTNMVLLHLVLGFPEDHLHMVLGFPEDHKIMALHHMVLGFLEDIVQRTTWFLHYCIIWREIAGGAYVWIYHGPFIHAGEEHPCICLELLAHAGGRLLVYCHTLVNKDSDHRAGGHCLSVDTVMVVVFCHARSFFFRFLFQCNPAFVVFVSRFHVVQASIF